MKYHIKTAKGFIWIITVTVWQPGVNSSSKFHSYLLAIGPGGGGVSHSQVIDKYIDESIELQQPQWRYNRNTRKFGLKCFEMLLYLDERPE